MPERGYGELFTAIHFRCNNEMPMMVYRACVATNTISNTRYIQEAVVARLAKDLGYDEQALIDLLPPSKTKSRHIWHPTENSKYPNRIKDYDERIGGIKTVEDVT